MQHVTNNAFDEIRPTLSETASKRYDKGVKSGESSELVAVDNPAYFPGDPGQC
jgi:hypothetical protein